MKSDDKRPPPVASRRAADDGVRTIASSELFGEDREVRIVHRGEAYRLRQTQLGKLILTK